MSRRSIHVKPSRDGWAVKHSKSGEIAGRYETREEATRAASRIADERNLDLIIHARRVGRFQRSQVIGRHSAKRYVDNNKSTATGTAYELNSLPLSNISSKTIHKSAEQAPQKKSEMWLRWAANHSHETNGLSDEAVSRESIYGERG